MPYAVEADGTLSDKHRIDLPLAHPSALCFGGPQRTDLFVTSTSTSTSDSGRLSACGPLDGAVLKLAGLGVRGSGRPMCRLPV